MERQTIYISGFPKSGNTWLTRLLGDILDSPTGGCMPEQDGKEVATEGQDRPGPYIVRKGHYVLIAGEPGGKAVPFPHRLAWCNITNERVLFLARDPRDVCVSGAYHWGQPVNVFLDRMIQGDVARCGRWDLYYHSYFVVLAQSYGLVKYEDLVAAPESACIDILVGFGLLQYASRIPGAIERQSFAARKAQIGDNEQELRRNNMRKGVAGDWHNHFTPAMNERIWNEFGWMMERLGYKDI